MKVARVANRPSPALAAAAALLVLACSGVFVDHFNATSYQHFTDLKAFHLKFIEDLTRGDGRTWDSTAFAAKQDEGELLFRQATEYARGRGGDTLRVHVFNILHKQFAEDCGLLADNLAEGNPFFSPVAGRELAKVVGQNYDYAIRGELARVKGKE